MVDAEAPAPLAPTVSKHHVGADLMHLRLGHHQNSSINLASQNDIWNDVSVRTDPESISETCQIMLSQCANHNHDHPADYPTKPGS